MGTKFNLNENMLQPINTFAASNEKGFWILAFMQYFTELGYIRLYKYHISNSLTFPMDTFYYR